MKNIQRTILLGFLGTVMLYGIIHAQTVDEIFSRFVKSYHSFQGTTLPYYIFTPESYKPEEKYPLILCLHGAGERGDDPSAVKDNSMAVVWARDSNQVRWPSFIVVPQCPYNGWWTNSNIVLNVNFVLDSLLDNLPIDTNRVYITGLSMGGYGTWDMIVRYPWKFAAAVPVCGGGDSSKASLIKNIPIWNFHGALDYTVPVINSRMMITALENAGADVVYTYGLTDSTIEDTIKNGVKLLYTEYENGGHSIWDQSYNNSFLLSWVFSQTKREAPSDIKIADQLPANFKLGQNFPNPFNPETIIPFSIPSKSFVSLKIYDLLGNEVATLLNEELASGEYHIPFLVLHFPLSSGVYFYRLEAGKIVKTKKLILLK